MMKALRFPFAVTLVGAAGSSFAQAMSADAVFAPRRRDDLLGGTTVLEGKLIRGGERIRATAVPCHLWSSGGAGEMTVWLDTAPAKTLQQP